MEINTIYQDPEETDFNLSNILARQNQKEKEVERCYNNQA